MGLVRIIETAEFCEYQKTMRTEADETAETGDKAAVAAAVKEIIAAVRTGGDIAVRRYAKLYEKRVPENFEVPIAAAKEAWENLKINEKELVAALTLASDNIRRFAELQKEQFRDFETEIAPGLFTGQRVIPVERSATYVPAGRFPLISTALMTLIPASVANVKEKILVSPPGEDGLPDRRILAAAYMAGADRIFALGGAQAIAALALGTESIPRVDLIVGPGNKYVAEAKRRLFGEVGIDFVAGPTDVLVITDSGAKSAELIAADMLAQAEHDPDARARALVPDAETAKQIELALERRLAALPTAATAGNSLKTGGLIVIYKTREEAISIANSIAPEHLELQVSNPEEWTSGLKNYGSLFIGSAAAEVIGDYSAGINHTLPTSTSARFTGGLSVRHFLKTVTTLRCAEGSGYAKAISAAEIIARAEGLAGHAESAGLRINAGSSKP